MSNDAPDLVALGALEDVLDGLTEELGAWRRRALKAESERAALGVEHDAVAAREQIVALERENQEMRRRLEAARGRVGALLSRLRFLEEQVALEAGS